MSDLDEALVSMICQIWKVLKATDIELRVYKNATTSLLEEYPHLAPVLSDYVAFQRQSSALQQTTTDKYALLLETFLRSIPARHPEADPVLKVLHELEPS